MSTTKFFDERKDQSEVKARIVQKYFFAWANVIMRAASKFGGQKIAYIDLYSGPGRYKDGSASTPLLVLQHAIGDSQMAKMLVSLFNDQDGDASQTLAGEIKNLPGVEKLKYQPDIFSDPVGKEIEEKLAGIKLVPTFTFFDPFGYKGLSQGIIRAVIKDWGCDCVFFFNYNRINAAITNERVEDHMEALFGKERVAWLRTELDEKRPHQREAIILEELAKTLRELSRRSCWWPGG